MLELSTIIAAGVARYQAEQAKYAPPLADVAELETTHNVSRVTEDRQRELCLSCPLSDCVGVESSACPIRIEARRIWSARSKATTHDCPCDCHYADSGALICSACLSNHRPGDEADDDE